MYLHTVSAYVDQIVDEIDASSVAILKSLPFDDLVKLHHSWGRAIRNEFGLWDANHPLTKHWHEKPEDHVMKGGFDYSPDHPDYVSMEIMRGVWRKVNS